MYMKRLKDFRNIYDTKYLKYEIVKFKCYTREIHCTNNVYVVLIH